MAIQIRKLTQAGADYWNQWAENGLVDAGQEVEYTPNKDYDVSCNGEEWCIINKYAKTERDYFEPLTTTEQEQQHTFKGSKNMSTLKETIVNKLQLLVDGKVEQYLKTGTDGWYNKKVIGICSHISVLAETGGLRCVDLTDFFYTWKHFSGSEAYPVPDLSGNMDDAGTYYNSGESLYVGRQLELRQSLAQHIINNIDLIDSQEEE